jgi:hypothetical protein
MFCKTIEILRRTHESRGIGGIGANLSVNFD